MFFRFSCVPSRLSRCFGLLLLATLPPLGAQTPPQVPTQSAVTVALIGDSTQTDAAGYGRGFCANLTAAVHCLNFAKGGASTRTFREQGLWQHALDARPDYMLIQFGHNDMETPEHLDRQVPMAQYETNLRRFVTEARAAGTRPVLVTPLSRRYFEADGKVHSDLLAHAATMKRVAAEMQVPLIDLQAESIALLDSLGEVRGAALGLLKKDPAGHNVPDKTHLNWDGSYVFGRLVAVDLGRAVPALAVDIRPQPATVPAEGQLAVRVLHGAPFKIVLVGDSTVATGGGWGPGFCALATPNVTCVDLALNGRSSKSFLDEGAWTRALAEKGQYYFIQFGHNDSKPDAARHTEPDAGFTTNLRRYIREARAIGAIPILVTSLSRRTYKDGRLAVDELHDYAVATRGVAGEEKVTLVDLYSLSTKLLQGLTQEQADTFDATAHPDAAAENGTSATATAIAAKPDRTHLNDKGKAVFGRMVADNVIRIEPELLPNFNLPSLPAAASPLQAAPTDGK